MRRAWKSDKARIDKYLKPHLGGRALDTIHEADMQALVDKLRPVLKPQSIQNCPGRPGTPSPRAT